MRAGKAALAFILVTLILDITAMGIVIPVLPRLIEQLAQTGSQAGLINGALVALWAGMQFLASPLIGSLSDRFGRRPILLASAAGLSADYVIMALAPNLWWIALGRALAGITSATFTTVYAYMADLAAPEKRAKAYGLVGAAFSAGIVAGPLIGGVLGQISPRAPFWAAGLLSALAFSYGLFVLPESLDRKDRMAFSWRRANPWGALELLRSRSTLLPLALINFFMYCAHYAVSTVFVLYAGHRYGWRAWEIGALLAALGICDVIVQSLLVQPLIQRVGEWGTLLFGLLAGAAGIAFMGLAPTRGLLVLSILPHALRSVAIPALQTLMTGRVSKAEQGQLQGATMSLISIAGVVSPVVFGAIYSYSLAHFGGESSASGSVFLVAALLLCLTTVGAGYMGWQTGKVRHRWNLFGHRSAL